MSHGRKRQEFTREGIRWVGLQGRFCALEALLSSSLLEICNTCVGRKTGRIKYVV